MKRSSLLQHLRRHGCVLKREGAAPSLWANPVTGAAEAVRVTRKSPAPWPERSAARCLFQNQAKGNSGCLTFAITPRPLSSRVRPSGAARR
jgi:hypothetical protein